MSRTFAGSLTLRALPLLAATAVACARDPAARLQPVQDLLGDLRASVRPAAAGAGSSCLAAARSKDGVFLPAGSPAVLFSSAPHASSLLVADVRSCGGPGRLRIAAESDEAPAVRAVVEVGETVVTRLPAAVGPVRIELEAVGRAGLVVRRLELSQPRPARAAGSVAASPPARRLDVLVYLIDALRRDELGCYGNRRPVSPHLDALAAEGALFADAIAVSSWTRPAVASLFTGLRPTTHGVNDRSDALRPEATTLAELLHGAGYRTGGFVTNPHAGARFGFSQGFERFRGFTHRQVDAFDVNRAFLDWLDAGAADPRPVFAYLHTTDPHGPYEPTAPWRQRFAAGVPPELGSRPSLNELVEKEVAGEEREAAPLRRLYDAEVAANDAAFGELRAALRRRGRWSRTLVVMLSDHGEEFREHGGWEHGYTLHREVLEVPLLIRLPGLPGGVRVRQTVRQVDLLPTILEAVGAPLPPRLEGRSLLPLLSGRQPPASPPVLSYLQFDGRRAAAVTTPSYRLIASLRTAEPELALYDRRHDRLELRDVGAERPVALAYLRHLLRDGETPSAGLAHKVRSFDPETMAQMRALGYAH